LQWLHYAETVAVHGATLTQQHIVIYEDKDRSPLLMKLETRRLEKALEVLDRHLEGRDYMLSTFSAVDVSLGYSVYVAQHFVKVAPYKALHAWFERISARPAYQKTQPKAGDSLIYRKAFYEIPVL